LKPHLIGLMAAALAVLPVLGFAQVKQLGPNATSQDFIDSLAPDSGAPALKFRGLRVLNANPTDQDAEANGPAVAVDIKFALNSAELTDQAKATLKQMAVAMKSDRLASYHFMLEGHTDTTGNPDNNLALSQRRAEAVRTYLTGQFGIDSSRLQAVGRGEDALLDSDHPTSPVNRRVQVVNMGG
jgi:outer membrane protein OmpA-like peptidoglycan-associated protein